MDNCTPTCFYKTASHVQPNFEHIIIHTLTYLSSPKARKKRGHCSTKRKVRFRLEKFNGPPKKGANKPTLSNQRAIYSNERRPFVPEEKLNVHPNKLPNHFTFSNK